MTGLFHDFHLERNIQGFGRQAHCIVTGLIAELAGQRRRSRRRSGGRLEVGDNFKIAGEDRERLLGKSVFLHARLGKRKAGGFERARVPGEAQRNQVFVRGCVAVDVIAGPQLHGQRGIDSGARLRGNLLRGQVVEDVSLREGLNGRLCEQPRQAREQRQRRERRASDRQEV